MTESEALAAELESASNAFEAEYIEQQGRANAFAAELAKPYWRDFEFDGRRLQITGVEVVEAGSSTALHFWLEGDGVPREDHVIVRPPLKVVTGYTTESFLAPDGETRERQIPLTEEDLPGFIRLWIGRCLS